MSVSISIVDDLTPRLQRIALAMNGGEQLNRVIANAALPVFQQNFRTLAASNHNKLGARSSGFWNRMLSGTKVVVTAEESIIRMPREVALRYFGGTVTPKASRFLAIPARTEAYNKSPRDFSDLHFAVLPVGGPVLIQNEQTLVRIRKTKKGYTVKQGETKGGHVFYWLRRSATIPGNSEVLPDTGAIRRAITTGVTSYFAFHARKKS